MEDNAPIAFLLALVAGAATGVGAALTFALRKNDFKIFALGMSFSAGVMVYLSFTDILPTAIAKMQGGGISDRLGHALAVLAFFAGVALAGVIDYFIPEHVDHEMVERGAEPHAHGRPSKAGRAAVFTAVALAIHNFPEGLSVFVAGLDDIKVGIGVAIAIMLHNIPEGVSVALPIYSATGNKLGAVFAYFALAPYLTPQLVGAALALTAGIMVYISLDELLPMAKEYGEEHYGIVGVFSGMAFMAAVSIIF